MEISLFFNAIPEQNDVFVPVRHEFKNSVTVETKLLRSHPFTNSQIYFLVIM
jgi:hypothetical protein